MIDKMTESRIVGEDELKESKVEAMAKAAGAVPASGIPMVATIATGECECDGSKGHHIFMGGDDTNPTWEEYLGQWKEELQPRFTAIRGAIEDAGLVGVTAGEWCNGHYFSFADGVTMGFSWRAWGDLMQAIVGKREGYMAYYM